MGNICCAPAPQNAEDASRGVTGPIEIKKQNSATHAKEHGDYGAGSYSQMDITYHSKDDNHFDNAKYQPLRNVDRSKMEYSRNFDELN